MTLPFDIAPAVRAALSRAAPVVALESTLISHGLPWPDNLDCARRLESLVRASGGEPATIAVLGGRIKIGLDDAELQHLARSGRVAKLSRRDLAASLACGEDGATTVAATMILAHRAGIAVFATGGIGGVHRGAEHSFDISADLTELGRTPVAVVCAGAKSILDLHGTLEVLETQGVPVVGYGTDTFPAFYTRDSGLPVSARVDTPAEAAALVAAQCALDLGGLVLAVPIPAGHALPAVQVEAWLGEALDEARMRGVTGKSLTPFLLQRLVELSEGRTLQANRALLENNARLAAEVAVALSRMKN